MQTLAGDSMTGLFAKKPLDLILAEAQECGDHTLRRALGPGSLISIGIGSIIGTGIFVLTGTAAANHAGPAILLSFVLAAVACVFAGLCYAEFASSIPVAGSAYTYSYATLGEFAAWMIGWDLVLEYALGAATVASGWSGYVLSFLQDFGIHLPPRLAGSPGTLFVLHQQHWERLTPQLLKALAVAHVEVAALPQQHASFNLIGFLGILLVTSILVIGIRESVTLTSVVVVIKISVLLVFIVLGIGYLFRNPTQAIANWTPFLPPNTGHYGDFGWSGIARGAGVIFFAYIGFDQVSTAAQESRNPTRDLPIGILGSLGICTLIYVLVAIVLTGLVKYTSLDGPAPIAMAIDVMGIRWGAMLVKIGAICGLSSAMVVTLLGQSRIFFSMSRDGLLPKWASAVHPRFRTPYISTIIVGAVVASVAALTPISVISELVSIGTQFAFVIVCGGILILRRRGTELPRAFAAPGIPFTPLAGMAVALLMMLSLGWETWLRLLIWLFAGLLVYVFYGRKHSRVRMFKQPNLAPDTPKMFF